MNDSSAIPLSALQAALPLPVFNPRRGVGSFVTFDLVDRSTNADVHIWIYLCDWEATKCGALVLSSNDQGIEGAPFEPLAGLTLWSISLDPSTGSVTFVFDNDTRLTLVPNLEAYSPDDDLVMFFRRGRKVMAISPQCWVHEAS